MSHSQTQSPNISLSDVAAAVTQLHQSDAGKQALRDLLTFFDGGGLKLDACNKRSVMTLLTAAWSTLPGTVLDELREAVGN